MEMAFLSPVYPDTRLPQRSVQRLMIPVCIEFGHALSLAFDTRTCAFGIIYLTLLWTVTNNFAQNSADYDVTWPTEHFPASAFAARTEQPPSHSAAHRMSNAGG